MDKVVVFAVAGLLVAAGVGIVISQSDLFAAEVKGTWQRQAPSEGYGDLNDDGMVTYSVEAGGSSDVLFLVWFYAGNFPPDVNGDGYVGQSDLDLVNSKKGQTGSIYWIPEDAYPDGVVSLADINVLASYWNMSVGSGAVSSGRLSDMAVEYEVFDTFAVDEVKTRGDVDGDGNLDINDTRLIRDYAKGDIDSFPVQEDGDNSPPVASLNQDSYSVSHGASVTFDASGSYDPDGDSLMYRFVFDIPAGMDGPSDTGWITTSSVARTFTLDEGMKSAGGSVELSVSDGVYEATVSSSLTVARETYSLVTTVEPSSSGSIDPPGGSFLEGETVTLTAHPYVGYTFSHWSGDVSTSFVTTAANNPLTITMDSDKTIAAHFSPIEEYTLTVNSMPSEGGTVQLDPTGGTYTEATFVTLTATPNEDYTFDHWSGDASGSSVTYTVAMDADKTVTAHFEEKPDGIPGWIIILGSILGIGAVGTVGYAAWRKQ